MWVVLRARLIGFRVARPDTDDLSGGRIGVVPALAQGVLAVAHDTVAVDAKARDAALPEHANAVRQVLVGALELLVRDGRIDFANQGDGACAAWPEYLRAHHAVAHDLMEHYRERIRVP